VVVLAGLCLHGLPELVNFVPKNEYEWNHWHHDRDLPFHKFEGVLATVDAPWVDQ
jgi:hypothetical protein